MIDLPADTVPAAVETIAKDLYAIDTVARVSGRTVGVMVYSNRLIDESGQFLAPETQELIGNLMLTVTRVALSTDREVDFVVVALREREKPVELRLTRYLVDIKKAQTDAIPIMETINRTLWENRQYRLDPVNPSYFPLDAVVFEEFLTSQIVQRLRMPKDASAAGGEEEGEFIPERLVEGKFSTVLAGLEEKRIFEFTILAFADFNSPRHTLDVFRTMLEVFQAYEFRAFDEIWIRNLLGRTVLKIDRETLERYEKGSLKDSDISDMMIRAPSRV